MMAKGNICSKTTNLYVPIGIIIELQTSEISAPKGNTTSDDNASFYNITS